MKISDDGRVACHICGKTFKDRRGLCGHLWSTHGIKASECDEYIPKGDEMERIELKLKGLFYLEEDLKELDQRLEFAKKSSTGSFFGLGLIPTKTDDDKRLVRVVEALVKHKEMEARKLLDDIQKLESTVIVSKKNKSDKPQRSWIDSTKLENELKKSGLTIDDAAKAQDLNDAGASDEEFQRVMKG